MHPTPHSIHEHHRYGIAETRRALTLIELLVVVALLAVLLSLLLPAIGATMTSARSFKCQVNQRAVAYDFALFSDDSLRFDRGLDRPGRFRLETFQESQYCIDEFWCWSDRQTFTRPADDSADPMRCPEVEGDLVLRRAVPCSGGGVGPPRSVSFGFNIRLHIDDRTRRRLELSPSMLTQPDVTPLFWDVNGQRAFANGVTPVYSGPSLDSPLFLNDRFWFPGLRHHDALNVSFIDGHTESTRRPLEQATWLWGFRPSP